MIATNNNTMLVGLAKVGRFGLFSKEVFVRIVLKKFWISDLARHCLTITRRCILPVTCTVLPVGMVIALQGSAVFRTFGAERLLSSMVGLAIFRELAPVMASALVAAQAGSSFAAELGSMRIAEELDATEVMAIDPLSAHVAPRVTATIIVSPILGLLGAISGLLGAYAVAVWYQGQSGAVFLYNLWNLTTLYDVIGGLVKCVVFGAIIGLIACYQGFHTRGGAAGVGKAVNDTVVLTITISVTVNYLLTSLFYGGG